MVSIDSAGKIRLSSQAVRAAGFKPGQRIGVVADGNNSFLILPENKVYGDYLPYSVEKDGRVRVSKSMLGLINVRAKKSRPTVATNKGNIRVTV